MAIVLFLRLKLVTTISSENSITNKAISGDKEEMAGPLGKIDEFDSTKEEWGRYQQRLDRFLAASEVADAAKKRSSILITGRADVQPHSSA